MDTIILALSVVGAFFMAFNNGANDVANSFASVVGSKALSIRKTLILASITTFLGTVLLGGNVTTRLVEEIVSTSLFTNPLHYSLAMLTVLIASNIVVLISTLIGAPVSSTHSIIGGLTGISLITAGWNGVQWNSLIYIAIFWIISPLISGILAFSSIHYIWKIIINYKKRKSFHTIRRRLAIFVFLIFIAKSFILLSYILPNSSYNFSKNQIYLIHITLCILSFLFFWWKIGIWLNIKNKLRLSIQNTFKYLQIGASCYVAFGNGANDIANSISPIFAIYIVMQKGAIPENFNDKAIPIWILAIGGFGIAAGIMLLGKNVMYTLGKKLTKINNINGFSVDWSVSTTIIGASLLGFPVSTTHASTGAILGASIASKKNIHFNILYKIIIAWLVTMPCAAITTIVLYKLTEYLFLHY